MSPPELGVVSDLIDLDEVAPPPANITTPSPPLPPPPGQQQGESSRQAAAGQRAAQEATLRPPRGRLDAKARTTFLPIHFIRRWADTVLDLASRPLVWGTFVILQLRERLVPGGWHVTDAKKKGGLDE